MRRAILMLAGLSCVSAPVFGHSGAAPRAAAAAPAAGESRPAAAGKPAPPPDQPAPVFRLETLSERAYCLFGKGGNVGILVSDSGVVVVDDQYEEVAAGIVEQIRTLSDKPIRFLVNTHFHADHTGGNPVFVKIAEILAHETVRPRLLEYPETVKRTFPGRMQAIEAEVAGLKDPADPYRVSLEKDLGLFKFMLGVAQAFEPGKAAPPAITYRNEVGLWLGGEEVEVFHVAPGHTDGDSMVYFKTEKVLHMGDLFFNGMYPYVDLPGGGSFGGVLENLTEALKRVAPDAKVIPGHGPVTDVAGLRRYRDFLSDLREEVRKSVQAGRSKADAVRAITMPKYPEIKPLFRTLGNDVAGFYEELSAGRK